VAQTARKFNITTDRNHQLPVAQNANASLILNNREHDNMRKNGGGCCSTCCAVNPKKGKASNEY